MNRVWETVLMKEQQVQTFVLGLLTAPVPRSWLMGLPLATVP